MLELIEYLWHCYKAYKTADTHLQYFSVVKYGVPRLAVIIARDREAWRMSQLAIAALESRMGMETCQKK